jgi:hypothetical protein
MNNVCLPNEVAWEQVWIWNLGVNHLQRPDKQVLHYPGGTV